MWHKGEHALAPGHRRLHCKLLVTDALECKALNCSVPTALLCTQWGLLGEHHIHGVALAAHFGVTLAEPGVLLPDPMAVTGPSHPFPRPGPGTALFTNGLQLASTTLASIPAHSGWLGHPVWGLLELGHVLHQHLARGGHQVAGHPPGPSYGAALVLRSTGWSWSGGTTGTM